MRHIGVRAFGLLLIPLLATAPVAAQSFVIDNNPTIPFAAPPGLGFGTENPFGIPVPGFPPGLAPSPSLPLLIGPNLGGGAILSPSPAPIALPAFVQHPGPDGFYLGSLSSNKAGFRDPLNLLFSVDRTSIGAPGTAVNGEALLSQAPGDVYRTTASFANPSIFAGTLASVGAPLPTFAGFLPGSGGPGGNTLFINQGLPGPGVPGLGLITGGFALGPGTVLPPGVLSGPIGPPGAAAVGTHDNVTAFDLATFDAEPDGLFNIGCYFSIMPAEAVTVGVSAASIFLAPAGSPGAVPIPFAPSATLGMDATGPHPVVGTPFSDHVDALVMWDNGAVGVLEPGIDFALFSLSPGSASLLAMAGIINDSDVFFTDFTGLFAVYGTAGSLGLIGDPAGGFIPRPFPPAPGFIDGLDALDIVAVPEPTTLALVGLGLAGLAGYCWRQRRLAARRLLVR